MRRQLRGDRFRGFLGDVVGIGTVHGEEYATDSIQHAAAEFERLDRVLERRGIDVGDYGFNLGIVHRNGITERRQIVLRFDAVERWHAKWRIPLVK